MSKQLANCPRCGYDLTGTVATWIKQCPLTGRCNECGLELDWSRVFVFSIHPWLFEYHWKQKPFSKFAGTIIKAFQPRRFWREVKLTDPVHLRPAAFVAGLLLLFAMTILVTKIAIADYRNHVNWIQTSPMVLPESSWSYGLGHAADSVAHIIQITLKRMPGLPAALLAMPLIFSLMPTTLRQARVKRTHILRIFIYSLIAPFVIACLWCAIYFAFHELGLYKATSLINPYHWRNPYTTSVLIIFIYQLLPGMALIIPCTIWMAYWWHQACKQYLQLKETRLIIILLTVVLFLFATLLELVFA